MDTIERIQSKLQQKGVPYNEPVSIERIREFEKANGVSLPEELILLYTRVCNGCEMFSRFTKLKRIEEWCADPEELQRAFTFEHYWIWDDNEDVDEDKLWQTKYGNLELVDIGDGESWNVIVNGSQRGQMWNLGDLGISPCAPPKNVLEWFEYWLDCTEKRVNYFKDFKY